MATRTLRNGQSLAFNIETGESLKAVAVSGTYTVTVVGGEGIGTELATAAAIGTYGPYAYQSRVRLDSSATSEIDFDVAVTPYVVADTVAMDGAAVSLSGAYTVAADDDKRVFTCTTALTITIPAGLSPRPSFIVNPPSSGNVSLDPTGAAQLNGAGTTLTRSRASNVAGFAVVPYAESDGYGVSGS
jgi:hypothetical protein